MGSMTGSPSASGGIRHYRTLAGALCACGALIAGIPAVADATNHSRPAGVSGTSEAPPRGPEAPVQQSPGPPEQGPSPAASPPAQAGPVPTVQQQPGHGGQSSPANADPQGRGTSGRSHGGGGRVTQGRERTSSDGSSAAQSSRGAAGSAKQAHKPDAPSTPSDASTTGSTTTTTAPAESSATGSAAAAPSVATPASATAPATALATPTTAVDATLDAQPEATKAKTPKTAGASPPSAGRRARRRAPRAHTRAASASHALATPAAATATRTAAAAAATSKRRARQSQVARHRHMRSRPSPLVTTITQIVGVVPLAVRLLIGLLFGLALALGVRSRLAALRARRLEHQRGQLLEDVGLLQAALLPVAPERLGPVGTSVAYRPADGPAAGGDFYDVFALEDGHLAVILGDVSGHGRQALPHTALVRFTLRAYLEAGLSPRMALQTAGTVLERQLGGSFATVVVATYQPRERILVYACAGHPPPLVLGSRAIAPITACSAPPVGAGMRTGTRQTVVSLPGSSQVCFYTDGVTEARVGAELFGSQRLARALSDLGSRVSASALLERVAQETDTRVDDMAACLLRIEGSDAPPVVLSEELELDSEEAGGERARGLLLACGLDRREVEELMRSTRVAAGRAGTVSLELHLAEGSPKVVLRRGNLGLLHAPRAVASSARVSS
jgi:serine phosphatase RsbU (regulator of sigma subunit)